MTLRKRLIAAALVTMAATGSIALAQVQQQAPQQQTPQQQTPMMGPGMMGPGMMGYGGMGPGMMGQMPMMGNMPMGMGMMGPGMQGMMGNQGMMGPGMMGNMPMGMMGQGMGPGMMGYGMGPGMTGPGMMGQGYWCPNCGMMGPYSGGGQSALNLTANDVKGNFERWIASTGNSNIKVGNVVEKDANTVTADIITKDNSLVQQFSVDRRTGFYRPTQ